MALLIENLNLQLSVISHCQVIENNGYHTFVLSVIDFITFFSLVQEVLPQPLMK